jgi:hypothetical protein
MGFVGLTPGEEPFIRNDGVSFTHAYPGQDGTAYFYTFRVGRVMNADATETLHHYLMVMMSKLDPRGEDFQPSDEDSMMAVPMTETAVYGLMNTLTSLRADMLPDTSGMLTSMFEPGHFVRN